MAKRENVAPRGFEGYFTEFTARNKADFLSRLAIKDATSRLSPFFSDRERFQATTRIWNAVNKRFGPYVLENEIISDQISSTEYVQFIDRQKAFLGVRVGGNACSDERIAAASIFDPRVSHLHRRVQGLLEAEPSKRDHSKFVLDDPIIDDAVQRTLQQSSNRHFVEFIGPHIDSDHPANGCGAAKAKVGEQGMQFGAIAQYYEEFGNKFHAFANTITEAGGKATLIDMTHDAYSQGLIFGLKDAYPGFKQNMSLRDNLLRLHGKSILMTELLDPIIRERMQHSDTFVNNRLNSVKLDLEDPTQFARNMILIGDVAREITQADPSYSLIPDALKKGKDEDAIRALAYHAIRNCVYRILGDIKPGQHRLRKHVSTNIRVGPTGATFNQQHGALVEVASHGALRPQDMADIRALNGVSKHVGQDLLRNPADEGRVIIVTGEYTETGNTRKDRNNREKIVAQVRQNAQTIRNEFSEDIANGRIIVIPTIHRGSTREIRDELSELLLENTGTVKVKRRGFN